MSRKSSLVFPFPILMTFEFKSAAVVLDSAVGLVLSNETIGAFQQSED